MAKEIHVFDCDGVLVDSSHRYRNLPNGSIDLDYWIRNNVPAKVAKDKLLPHAGFYRRSLRNPDIYTVIATARQCKMADLEFFRDVLGFPQKLIYRREGDIRSDWLLKAMGLRRLLNLRQFQKRRVTVWEDNPVTIANLEKMFPDWRYILVPSKQGA